MESLSEVISAVQLLQKRETERMKITLANQKAESECLKITIQLKQEIYDLQTRETKRMKITLENQKAESERIKITIQLKQEIYDLQTSVSELIQRDEFLTKQIDDKHSKTCSKQYEGLEICFQNLRNRLNLIDNKSRAKNVLINNVEEKSTENATQLLTKVTQIMQDVDNSIHVTHAYRIGKSTNKIKTKPRPIIACLQTEKPKYAAVKQAFRLKKSTQFKNAFISEDLCPDFKISRQEQLSKYKDMKQKYRTVCFKGTELIGKIKKQSVTQSHSSAHHSLVIRPAPSLVTRNSKHISQNFSGQLTPRPPSPCAPPVTNPARFPVSPITGSKHLQLTLCPPSPHYTIQDSVTSSVVPSTLRRSSRLSIKNNN